MHPDIQKLIDSLDEAQSLLDQYGVTDWGNWLEKDARLIKNLDFYGIEHLLSAYGGMGSINDLVIHHINGHKIKEPEVNSVNERFDLLRTKIYSLAKKLAVEEASVLCNA